MEGWPVEEGGQKRDTQQSDRLQRGRTQDSEGGIPLSMLPVGGAGVIKSLAIDGLAKIRLLDLGFVPGTRVEAVRRSPFGDPVAFRVRGTLIALRKEESDRIIIK